MPVLAEIDTGTILILIVLAALPIGAVVFALGAGNALKQIGKGDLAIDQDVNAVLDHGPDPHKEHPLSQHLLSRALVLWAHVRGRQEVAAE